MSDRRNEDRRQTERRVQDLPVAEDRRVAERRIEDRRSGDLQTRRQVMDRRQNSLSIDFEDRRKGSRRVAEKEAASKGEEAVPDWMEGVLAEAAQRQEENPAMSPPPVDEKENNYFNRSEEEIKRQERIWDLLIMAFVLCCFAGLIAVLVYGV